MKSAYKSLQEQAWAANQALYSSGLVSLTFGNISVADQKSAVFSIKPSGVSYQKLQPADMVVLDFDGVVLAGKLRPSTDTPTHRLLLQELKKVSSVVHTHSPKATAFAQAGKPLDCFGTTHADYFHGSVPVSRSLTPSEIESDYELNTGRAILEGFTKISPYDIPAVLVSGHGSFAWGSSWEKAIESAIALELCASIAMDTLLLNPQKTTLNARLIGKHYSRKHGATAYYGQL